MGLPMERIWRFGARGLAPPPAPIRLLATPTVTAMWTDKTFSAGNAAWLGVQNRSGRQFPNPPRRFKLWQSVLWPLCTVAVECGDSVPDRAPTKSFAPGTV